MIPGNLVSIIRFADIGDGSGRFECDALALDQTFDRHFSVCQRLSAVKTCRRSGPDGCRLRSNGQCTIHCFNICKAGCLVFAFRVFDLVSCFYDIFTAACIGLRTFCDCFHMESCRQTFCCHIIGRERLSVVGLLCGCCSQSHLRAVCRYGQRTQVFRNLIVGCIRTIPYDGIAVCGRSDLCDGSGRGKGNGLFTCQTFDRYFFIDQRRAVKGLFTASCRDGDRRRIDLKRAAYQIDICKVCCDISAVRICDNIVAVYDICALTDIGLGAAGGRFHRKSFRQTFHFHRGICQCTTVIGLRCTRCGQ